VPTLTVKVRNNGSQGQRATALLAAAPSAGLTIDPVGDNPGQIASGRTRDFRFKVTFASQVLGSANSARIHFTATAVDQQGRVSAPASPRRDTVVRKKRQDHDDQGGDEHH
jgi:hypothetical protein